VRNEAALSKKSAGMTEIAATVESICSDNAVGSNKK
jgi:hypothetical protein